MRLGIVDFYLSFLMLCDVFNFVYKLVRCLKKKNWKKKVGKMEFIKDEVVRSEELFKRFRSYIVYGVGF